MAPELLVAQHGAEATYDAKVDIWSLGITAIELATTEPPLASLAPLQAAFRIPVDEPPRLQSADKPYVKYKTKLCD